MENSTNILMGELYKIFPTLPPKIVSLKLELGIDSPPLMTVSYYPFDGADGYILTEQFDLKRISNEKINSTTNSHE